MSGDDIRDRIGALEREAERNDALIGSCRKAMTLAKAAMTLGAAIFFAGLTGALNPPPAASLAAIAAMIGGVVFYGSNRSTRLEAEATAKAIDKQRSECIDRLDLFDASHTLH